MALTRGDWLNLALCAAIIAMLTLAYNLGSSANPHHTQNAPHPRSTEPKADVTEARLRVPEAVTVIDGQIVVIERSPESPTTIIVYDAVLSALVGRIVATQARNGPRLIEVCREGKCEKRWAVPA